MNAVQSTSNNNSNLAFPIALAALLMGAVAMGISPVFVRLSETGPLSSAFWRVFLALPFLFVWARWELKRHGETWQPINRPVLLSGLLFAGDLTFWHLAIVNTTMANATLTACMAPVWVLLFAGYFIGEKVYLNSWIGLAFCVIGALLLMGSSFQYAPERLTGDLFGIITSIFFGLYFLAIRVARKTHRGAQLTFQSTIITSAFLFCVAMIAVSLGTEQFFPASFDGALNLLALGLISHSGGQGLLAIALGSLSAVFSSLVIFMEAVAGAFFGYLVFDEKLTALQWMGAGFILGGIWIARPRSK